MLNVGQSGEISHMPRWSWAAIAASALCFAPLSVPSASAEEPTPVAKKKSKKKFKTGIAWNVTPGHVEIYLDGKKIGKAADLKQTITKKGRHSIGLKKGGDEVEFDVKVVKGQILRIDYEFTE